MGIAALLFLAAIWLAYSNGANDNYKGVATLFGTGTTDYRTGLRWATWTTFAGSLTAVFLAGQLVKAFSGKGLVSPELVAQNEFLAAVGLGASATVFLAAYFGIPISTTHSLTGALVGAGIAGAATAGGSWSLSEAIDFVALRNTFVVPLLVSPFLALAFAYVFYNLFKQVRLAMGIEKETCLCVGEEPVLQTAMGLTNLAAAGAMDETVTRVSPGNTQSCEERYLGRFVGIEAQWLLDKLHFLSAGAVSFARGLNDTPKIVSLLVVAGLLDVPASLVIVGVAIALGGWFGARKVAKTMSLDITGMNHGQGFSANLVTAFLVICASRWGVPVSTTHVSCGSLFGIGMANGELRWKVFGGILLAWVATLPLAALCAGLAYVFLSLA